MKAKRYHLSKEKIQELKDELNDLETRGRQDISEKLSWLRQQPNNEEDNPFDELLEDKNFLEKRIFEIHEILMNSDEFEDTPEESEKKKVTVGSHVKVGFEHFEEEYVIVSSIEADPLRNKISDESPVGKSLLGASVGDIITVNTGALNRKFRILDIK